MCIVSQDIIDRTVRHGECYADKYYYWRTDYGMPDGRVNIEIKRIRVELLNEPDEIQHHFEEVITIL